MTESSEAALSETQQTLAMLLEFLSKLQQSGIKTEVITQIGDKVKHYITRNLDKFATEGATSGYLYRTISNSKELRMNILKTEENYKHYKPDFDKDGISDTNKYTELLINNIFPLFGCLYYMYYECGQQCDFIKGGEWREEKCDGSGNDLNKWLTDTAETGTGKGVILRGFQEGDLSSNEGSKLFPSGSSTDALLYFKDGAQLQFALYYMLFLPDHTKWNNAQSGHAVLFLKAFCWMVGENAFGNKYTEADGESFKTACQSLRDNIERFIDAKTIVPVAADNKTVKYNDLLDKERFWNYVKWLKDNLEQLIKSLKEMLSDVQHWNQESLKSSSTFGPYPWGFTFAYNGDQNWTSGGGPEKKLKEPLQEFTEALETFKNALPSTSEGKGRSKRSDEESSASTASTIGGVAAGVGAAGAAGAAAYSGVLGPVAEAIGRFFKGLVL